MATNSKLTSLAEQKKQLGHKTMSVDAITWLKGKVEEIKRPTTIPPGIAKETFRRATVIRPGYMYCYFYDPKTKEDMEYWDKFPMVLVLEKYNDGFLGLNLHYLPPKFRIAFLTKLMKFAQLNVDDDIKRMRITYDILSASKRYAEFRPCLKRYLYSHMRSRILTIQPNEWDVAAFLPVQQFHKATANKVWQESVESIRA